MGPDLVRRLSSGEGWGLLQALPPYDEQQVIALGDRLRGEGFDPELVAAALTQSRLRARGRDKFGDRVDAMLLTPDGVEQATRSEIAARHAARFVGAGVTRVWDLGCGIGADAMGAAAAGLTVSAVDSDPATVAVAEVNLRGWPSARVRQATVEEVLPELPHGPDAVGCGAWLDPARRVPGATDAGGRTRRIFRLEEISPSWDTVREVASRVPAAGAKLSPAFPHARVPEGAEAQWTSYRGEALECTVWWGDAVRVPGRTAAVHTDDGWVEIHDAGTGPAPTLATAEDIGGWLYEPDRAVLQAGLVGTLAAAVQGSELDGGVGYVGADQVTDLPWARRWRVLEVLPLHPKRLRSWARDHDLGRLTIKKRGVRLDADELRRQLRLKGSAEAVVVVTRIVGRPVVLHVQPH
ncbi:THUMP-like domain-containing protein [Ornithinicoccus hortensis]|uniref:THUMP-like domain-containing protein n=2 Tax=Ornithinicoccus hortensis TaxID=82346 RepID=A0A542YQL3_9MICO|nr:class I SAM-dependent methyltransferase [Ornithinicoccus hortensis]TQL50204.1 hypothetical protein FB467_1308 [Ornithinicoccus hortensis]